MHTHLYLAVLDLIQAAPGDGSGGLKNVVLRLIALFVLLAMAGIGFAGLSVAFRSRQGKVSKDAAVGISAGISVALLAVAGIGATLIALITGVLKYVVGVDRQQPRVVHTDDGPRGLEYRYMGHPDMPLPPATIPTYLTWLGLTIVLAVVLALIMPSWWLRIPAILAAPAIAYKITKTLMPHVSYWTPVRYWRRLFVVELLTPRAWETDTPPIETRLDVSVFSRGTHQ